MGKIIEFEEPAIVIERKSDEFMTAAHTLGDYLNTLPLTNVQHNTLIKFISDQVGAAERSAYMQGLGLGVKIGKEFA